MSQEINDIVEKVGAVLQKLDDGEVLAQDDINYIPLNVLKERVRPLELERYFSLLSEEKRKKLLRYLPCHDHYNRDDDEEHIDGPPPSKYMCIRCKF